MYGRMRGDCRLYFLGLLYVEASFLGTGVIEMQQREEKKSVCWGIGEFGVCVSLGMVIRPALFGDGHKACFVRENTAT
jgi:hypothetical protein